MSKLFIVNSSLRKARLLKTGQFTSYGSGTGIDDGATEKGIAKSYLVLTTGRYAGTVAIVLNGKTDNHSNNCVLDKNTGLMWARYLIASVGPTNNGLLPWTTDGNGDGIFPCCAAANTARLAGYPDWRVPNIFELFTLPDLEAPDGKPDTVAFPSIGVVGLWSSNTVPNTVANAHYLYTAYGSISGSVAKTTTFNLLLVRGG